MPDGKSGCAAPARPSKLRLLGSFELRIPHGADTTASPLEPDERRLLALLAMSTSPRPAGELAALLWPGRDRDTALGTLAGVCDSLGDLVTEVTGGPVTGLRLAEGLDVDVQRALELLRAWEQQRCAATFPAADELIGLLSRDLLPGWTDEWVQPERERFRRVRMHALESLCRRLTDVGRHEPAIRAGQLVVTTDPLRESARRALIEAHLAAGSVSEAMHQYEAFLENCAKLGIVPAEFNTFFPPSPAWPVLHVRRPIHPGGGPIGRGMRMDPAVRRAQVGMGAGVRG